MSLSVDLNCDVGESFGIYRIGQDAELLNFATSANIACGFHAGDPSTMRKTVRLAMEKDVSIGAHPSLPDLVGFGRRSMHVSPQEVQDMVIYQIGALQAFVQAEGAQLRHVKPHGALYNMAAQDARLAQAIAEAIRRVNSGLVLMGLSGSELIKAGKSLGLATASEVFADRSYQANGSLTPRDRPGALIADAQQAAERVCGMIQQGKVLSEQGTPVTVQADTVCIHGDEPGAVRFAQSIREQLQKAGITTRCIWK